ncbi:MAG TPA: ATP-binding protein [Candidatus Sulfotelmatobacter sp.]|nr:ATP-binding protein [Candidatus Sulfotelmatobacter sp.]
MSLPVPQLAQAMLVPVLPILVIFGAMVLFGELGPLPAVLYGALLAAVGAAFAVRHARELWHVAEFAGRLASDADAALPRPGSSFIAVALVHAIARLHRDLAAERRRLVSEAAASDAVLDSLPDPLLILDADRRVQRANQAAANLFGGALQGRELIQVLRHPAVLDAVKAVLAGGAGSRQIEFVLPVPVSREFSARAVALRQASGRPVAILALQDLTAVKRAEEMRADFVANASHELRTPLATLIGFIETLQGPARDDAEARTRFLGIMREQAERMARLIRDLLSLSQIEMNEHTLPQGQVDVREAIGFVVDMLQIQANAKGMQIEVDAGPGLPPVVGDSDELIQVFQNLLDNAIKYGRRDTKVVVSIKAPRGVAMPGRGSALTVAVADRGEGIAREHLPRLTERFYRVDSARSRALGGTGLGLAIVKHIVNRHRGSLTIDSVEGEGSTFTVFLPIVETGQVTAV